MSSQHVTSKKELNNSAYYYEVLVASAQYHKDSPLTYRSYKKLSIGNIVVVPMQGKTVVGVLIQEVLSPNFVTKDILEVVGQACLPTQLLDLISWLRNYYPAPSGQILSLFLPSMLATGGRPHTNDTIEKQAVTFPGLTQDQKKALAAISKNYPKTTLLHGDTSTGKTRVYLELARKSLENGRSVLLLTPEIGLTPQLALAAEAGFPDRTIVIHSELGPAKRRDTWLRILDSKKPIIVIGPRSALFTPLHNIGTIVIDECHEPAYKQEQAPHYLASRVAAHLAELHNAQLVLGSATPSIEDYYAIQNKGLPIVRMREPALKQSTTKPDTIIRDLKRREFFTQSPWISDDLIIALKYSLQLKQQSLLFLNRRGTARVMLCKVCGWQSMCPRCDLPLTYHDDKHISRCHTCGYTAPPPLACPSCSNQDIIFQTIGTKALVSELKRLFPSASVLRFDSDISRHERLERQYERIQGGAIDILVGTQMIGKGLDLPKLSVLGIVLAETGLSFPDYTAEERTFQLLTQVIGRVHRGHIAGKVFIQTYHPESPVLQSAIQKNYESLYEQQIVERKRYAFPPFRFMLKLTCSRASSASARRASEQLAQRLRDKGLSIEVIGPGPAFIEKAHNRYRWQLIVKSVRRSELTKIIHDLPSNWSYDIDPINLL